MNLHVLKEMGFTRTGTLPARLILMALLVAPGAGAFAQAEPPPDPASGLEARAEEQIDRGEIFAAIQSLEEAVAARPGRSDLRVRLAGLQKKRGMWLRAADHYRAVLDQEPVHLAARMGYAELLLADYQFAAAEENFRILLGRGDALDHQIFDRAQIGLGTTLYGAGRYREAIKAYGVLLERHPDEPTARAYTNFALRNLGDLDGAVRGWTHLIDKRPDLTRAKLLLVEIEELRADILRMQERAKVAPDDPLVHRQLGELLMDKPDLEGAIGAFSRAATIEPDDTRVRMRLGTALREAGHLQPAADIFRSLSRDPDLGSIAGYNLAWCERRIAGPAAEADAWRSAVVYNPADTHAYRRFIDAVGRSGHLERELGLLLTAVNERPTDPLPKVQYAVLSVAMGKNLEAALALLDALSYEPNHPWAQREFRRILILSPGLSDRLLERIEKAEGGVEPGSPVALYRRAAVSLAAGDPGRCVAVLEPHVASATADARAAVALAGCLRAAGSTPGRVIGLLEAARNASPDYLYARLNLALALSSLGRFKDAAVEARAAAALDGDNVYALTALGIALNEVGGNANLVKADVALRRALEVSPMDPTGVARIMRSKVAWKLGHDREARFILKGDLPVEPDELYQVAWEFVRDNYRDRNFNGQNWETWRERFTGSLESETDALSAVALMLASLDDRDTRLRSSHQTEAHMFTRRADIVDRDPEGRATASSRTVASESLEENVGYVAVTNMHDPKLQKDVEEAFEKMEKKDAVILDLRGNLGGSERDAEAIAGMLVKPGTPTGSILTPKGEVPSVSRGVEEPKVPDKPIVVLVDRNTASSAEALAGALKESKRAVVVGENTYGKAGIQRPLLLPGGTMLLLATSENADLEGVSYSGRGIAPDVSVEEGQAGTEDSDAALLKAREIIRKKRMAPGKGQESEPNP